MNKFGILCFTVAVFAVCHVQASPLQRPDAAEYQNCKNLCGLCDCVGFYCGDECICECHNKNDGSEWHVLAIQFNLNGFVVFFLSVSVLDLNCVEEVQNNCEKEATPFEVLIQGPSGSRFVRSLVLADANAHKEPIDPTYVSTISIFQPNGNKKLAKREAQPDIDSDVAEALANSGGINHLFIHLMWIFSTYFTSLNKSVWLASADAATIDEKTVSDDAAQADAGDDKKDEKVGLALPFAPLIGAKLLPLNVNLGLIKQGIRARLLPLGLGITHPILAPGLIAPKIAAAKARIGLGLLVS